MKILAVTYTNNDTGMRMMGLWGVSSIKAIHAHMKRIDATLESVAEIEQEDYNAYRATQINERTTASQEVQQDDGGNE